MLKAVGGAVLAGQAHRRFLRSCGVPTNANAARCPTQSANDMTVLLDAVNRPGAGARRLTARWA